MNWSDIMGTSSKSKFLERLKRILFFRRKKIIPIEEKKEFQDSQKIYTDFLKVTAAIPGLVYGSIVANTLSKTETIDDSTNVIPDNQIIMDKQENTVGISDSKQHSNTKKEIKNKKRELINSISIDELKNKQQTSNGLNNKPSIEVDKNSNRIKELEKSIINLIKKDLIKVVNEMEVLQSELYILSEVNGESKELKGCQEELDHVKSMLCKIDKLKEQYDFLKDNYDFEYLLEIDNNDIVDKIIELKDLCANSELKIVAEDYKLLDVYRYLYLKIDDLQDKTIQFEDKKEEELANLKERDIDFEDLKRNVYNVEATNKNYDSFVRNQNELLDEIESKVHKINSYEQVSYHLKGFRELFMNSFKYFGLLMVSPLKGIIPSIATETIITGNLIKNLYNNLEWEETRRMEYAAIDYSNLLSHAMSDLESTSDIVDKTLDDIVKLKMKYNDKFKVYQGDFLEYQDIMHKINDMENKILGNKIKIEIMKKRTLDQRRANDKKLVLVREMNEKEAH